MCYMRSLYANSAPLNFVISVSQPIHNFFTTRLQHPAGPDATPQQPQGRSGGRAAVEEQRTGAAQGPGNSGRSAGFSKMRHFFKISFSKFLRLP